jgi:hypothetical protein
VRFICILIVSTLRVQAQAQQAALQHSHAQFAMELCVPRMLDIVSASHYSVSRGCEAKLFWHSTLRLRSENIELMITDAIKQAPSEHVVYFLLTAYVETLGCVDLGIPEDVKRLPISGKPDVHERLGIMRDVLNRPRGVNTEKAVVEEAVDVFGAASEQLERL